MALRTFARAGEGSSLSRTSLGFSQITSPIFPSAGQPLRLALCCGVLDPQPDLGLSMKLGSRHRGSSSNGTGSRGKERPLTGLDRARPSVHCPVRRSSLLTRTCPQRKGQTGPDFVGFPREQRKSKTAQHVVARVGTGASNVPALSSRCHRQSEMLRCGQRNLA